MTSLGLLADRTFGAVIFDNDGTLTDSTAAVQRCWLAWAADHDVAPERLLGFHGVPAATIIAELVPHADQAQSLARIDELELSDLHDVLALPGAADALQAVLAVSAIATSATGPLAHARIVAAGLPEPAVLVTFDDVQHGKPAPDPFLLAARRLGVDPADCLIVEDAPAGIAAARAAGSAVLALTTTTPAAELDADAVVDTLAQVRFEFTDGRVRLHPAD